ncbi:MAG: type I toxin-antitoxin system Fst family toxin [Selenomonas sp.]|nr:type I toxin-antitoxin system Fst family toxin [Selenomonas sp.]
MLFELFHASIIAPHIGKSKCFLTYVFVVQSAPTAPLIVGILVELFSYWLNH